MIEIWKDIENYEGYYQVSNLGSVRSLDRYIQQGEHMVYRRGKIISQNTNTDGYKQFKLCRDGSYHTVRTHIIVAKTFIDNRSYEDGWEVNHIDMDRANNCVDNLEWMTREENVNHSAQYGKYQHFGSNNPNYGNDTLKKKFEENPELRKLVSRPGGQNGMAIPLRMTCINTGEMMEFPYIGKCCEYLRSIGLTNSKVNSLRNTIKRHLSNETIYKKKYKFDFI